VLRSPVDVEASRLSGTALNQLEQAVAGADIPPAVGLENNGRPCPADTGIDDAEKHGSRRKTCGIDRQQIGRCLGIADRRIGEEVDNGYVRRHLVQHRLHLARIGALQPEIRKQHNHAINLPSALAPGNDPMAAIGTDRRVEMGQSTSALPLCSDVDLLGKARASSRVTFGTPSVSRVQLRRSWSNEHR
jgi:hypothetical protein